MLPEFPGRLLHLHGKESILFQKMPVLSLYGAYHCLQLIILALELIDLGNEVVVVTELLNRPPTDDIILG